MSSASALDAPSLITLGAPSTNSLASFNPNPVTSRTALMTLTLAPPTLVSYTHLDVYKRQISGMDTRSGFRKRSNRSWYLIGSMSVISRQ